MSFETLISIASHCSNTMFTEKIDGTACSDCGGTLAAVGPKEEGTGWKYYCDCTECGKEYGATRVPFEKHEERDSLVERHVRACSE